MIRVQVGGRHGAPRLLELHEDLAVEAELIGQDRKSTRLNSSHLGISYAVFCLKKKRKYKVSRRDVQQNRHGIIVFSPARVAFQLVRPRAISFREIEV